MNVPSSAKDPHSFALPELARVIHTDLELIVDFDQRVLEGKAILTITRQPSINQIILDNLGLDIGRVTNVLDRTLLDRHIDETNFAFGNAIRVDLPSIIGTDNPDCKIKIEYKTTPQSDALYWLTPAQTGGHPFLLSNNKLLFFQLIYARSWFPCQNTPSVKFTYSATIRVRKPYTVLMSALSQGIHEGPELDVHVFRQEKKVPSYAVVIAVGSLRTKKFNKRISIFAEENTFQFQSTHVNRFRHTAIEEMLLHAQHKYVICVLPPSIAHFEIECLCVTFISPTLLGGDCSYVIYSLARNISQSWAGNFVTKIRRNVLYHDGINAFLQGEGLKNFYSLVREPANVALLRCLLPNFQFTSELPHVITKYVPYEMGYFFLCHLENILGGPTVFEPFFISYFRKFAYESINTKDWKDYLYKYFSNKKEKLDRVNWDFWFGDTFPHPNFLTTSPYLTDQMSSLFMTIEKLDCIYYQFFRFNMSGKMRFLWLLLCIKIRWADKVAQALNFATEHCSPNYACPIFQHLCEWEEMRIKAIETYNRIKGKMLNETRKKIKQILQT
ncbi:Leukotriene A(4) hydrolase [Temnothorax longispinosus]|uniref:Leukotriene A(4) hydrolase n=1 Tax=Temnothorax longispinosus TaxID=300112 RepID=A0A4S2KTF0_9HYME|nr:Leukotriene A(4) hydrolase [Temnothorax longispinosus]